MRFMMMLFAALTVLTGHLAAESVWVNGHTRRDGTQVDGYFRSGVTAHNVENKSYALSEPALKKSSKDQISNRNTSKTRHSEGNNADPSTGESKRFRLK
jgi:hypothetical protein